MHPRPDLEESIIDLQFLLYKSSEQPPKIKLPIPITKIQIFDVSREGYAIVDNRLTDVAIDLDSAPSWRVAYNCSTGTLYHLSGLGDSEDGFTRLMDDLHLHLVDVRDALAVFDTFTLLSYKFNDRAIKDRLDLFEILLSQYSGSRSASSFWAYWTAGASKVEASIFPPNAEMLHNSFRVIYFEGVPSEVRKAELAMDANGGIHRGTVKVIYRLPPERR